MSQSCAKSEACVMDKKRNESVFQCWWSREEGVRMIIQRIVLNLVRGIYCNSLSVFVLFSQPPHQISPDYEKWL